MKIKILFLAVMGMGFLGYQLLLVPDETETSGNPENPENSENIASKLLGNIRKKLHATPLRRHINDLQEKEAELSVALDLEVEDVESDLRRLWLEAGQDYKDDLLSPSNSEILAKIINELNEFNQQRNQYKERYQKIVSDEIRSVRRKEDADRNKNFLIQEYKNQWVNAVNARQSKLKILYAQLEY